MKTVEDLKEMDLDDLTHATSEMVKVLSKVTGLRKVSDCSWIYSFEKLVPVKQRPQGLWNKFFTGYVNVECRAELVSLTQIDHWTVFIYVHSGDGVLGRGTFTEGKTLTKEKAKDLCEKVAIHVADSMDEFPNTMEDLLFAFGRYGLNNWNFI